jgi:hypothetical protein
MLKKFQQNSPISDIRILFSFESGRTSWLDAGLIMKSYLNSLSSRFFMEKPFVLPSITTHCLMAGETVEWDYRYTPEEKYLTLTLDNAIKDIEYKQNIIRQAYRFIQLFLMADEFDPEEATEEFAMDVVNAAHKINLPEHFTFFCSADCIGWDDVIHYQTDEKSEPVYEIIPQYLQQLEIHPYITTTGKGMQIALVTNTYTCLIRAVDYDLSDFP